MRKMKKGFTLVELLVVIAILGILATVSILGYSAFTKKADISNDEVIVSQMNLALKSNETLGDGAKYEHQAIQQCIEAGFILENLTPSTTGYHYAYDQANNRFILLTEDYEFVFGEDNYSTKNYYIYVVVGSDAELKKANNAGFSTYLRSNFEYKDNTKEIDTNKGIDVGDNTASIVNYDNTKNNPVKQNVIIHSNGGKLIVNGKIGTDEETSDEIIHYGSSQKVELSVADFCFYTHATIGYMNAKNGKVIADEDAYVYIMKATDNVTVEERNGGLFIIPQGVSQDQISTTVLTTLGYKVEGETIVVDKNSEVGKGKEGKSAYLISSKEDLLALREVYYAGKFDSSFTIVLNGDIDLTGSDWTPIGNWEYPFHGTLDGQGYTIKGLTATSSFGTDGVYATGDTIGFGEVFGFFGIVGNGDVTIQNLNFVNVNIGSSTAKNVGTLIGYAPSTADFTGGGKGGTYASGKWQGNTTVGNTNITVKNVTVSGNITANSHVGGLVGKIYAAGTMLFENCTNSATITETGTSNGGIAGIIGYTSYENTVIIKDCKNTAEAKLIVGDNAAVGLAEYVWTTNIKTVKYEGNNEDNATIVLPQTITLLGYEGEKELVVEGKTIGTVRNVGSMVIRNCTVTTLENHKTMVIESGTFNGALTNTAGLLTIRGGTFNNTITNKENANLTIYGGTYNYTNKHFINNGHISINTHIEGKYSSHNVLFFEMYNNSSLTCENAVKTTNDDFDHTYYISCVSVVDGSTVKVKYNNVEGYIKDITGWNGIVLDDKQ